MNQIIYNSFPRSGNVYAGYVGAHIIWGDYATVHIPQIFGTKDLDMISIFRKPEDAIASLINKRLETSLDKILDPESIKHQAKELLDEYKKYIKYATNNNESMYIIKFDDLIEYPVQHFVDISNKFNRLLLKDYQESFNALQFKGRLWEDEHDGHVPRKKNESRLFIDNIVGSLDFISQANKEYEQFIEEYKNYEMENK
jgi:hypothetical protein